MDDDDTTIAPVAQTTLSVPVEAATTFTSPIGFCALGVNPVEDSDLNDESGFRFGKSIFS